jgi:hypothetical protein
MLESSNLTTNPTRYALIFRHPKAHESIYREWLYGQLSRMPYLRRSFVREAICRLLAPDLSQSLDAVAADAYLRGWSDGFAAISPGTPPAEPQEPR